VTTSFTWDINAGLPVVLDDGAQYLYGAGLEAMKQSGNWFYYLADGLGSTMAIVNASGSVQNSYAYDVYGKPTVTGSLSNEFDFAGQQTDATGLQYLRARYMDPETGTFASREPMAVIPGWTDNGTSYAGSSPVRYTDPTGRVFTDEGGGCGGGCDPGYQGENGPSPCVLSYECEYDGPPVPGPGDRVDMSGHGGICNQSNFCDFIAYAAGAIGEFYGVKVNRAHTQEMLKQKWNIDDLYDVLQDPEYVYRQTKRNTGLFAHVRKNKSGTYDVLATDKDGIIYGSERGVSSTRLSELSDEFGWITLP
jgi:RHS repeat-associated protein